MRGCQGHDASLLSDAKRLRHRVITAREQRAQVSSRVRCLDARDFLGRPFCNEQAAVGSRFGAEIDHMVRAFDHFEIVLDHEQRIPLLHETVEDLHEHRDVVKVQSGRRLVEDEQRGGLGGRRRAACAPLGFACAAVVGGHQPLDELQPLALAAAQSVERLAEADVAEADLLQHAQRRSHALCAMLPEKFHGLRDREFQHVMDAFSVEADFQNVRLVSPPLALRAAHKDVAEELHLDLFKAAAAASLAAARTAIERKRARAEPLAQGLVGHRKHLANVVEDAEVECGGGFRRPRKLRLIHEDDLRNLPRADELLQGTRLVPARDAFCVQQIFKEHAVDERALARTAHAGDAREDAERNFDREVLQVVLARALDAEPRGGLAAHLGDGDGLGAGEVGGGQRWRNCKLGIGNCKLQIGFPLPSALRTPREIRGLNNLQCTICNGQFAISKQFLRRPREHQLPAALPSTRPEFDEVIRRAHDGFLVLDDEQRVAFVAQRFHHADEPARVARVQADARLVEDEERVHERRAEARREIHTLDFAAAERARGAVEREIAEADFEQEAEAGADFAEKHLGRGVIAEFLGAGRGGFIRSRTR